VRFAVRLVTLGALSALTVILVTSWSSGAWACSCAPPGAAEFDFYRAPLAFRGRVASVENLEQRAEPRQLATVDVIETWKGNASGQVAIHAGGPNGLCGTPLRAGDVHVFLLHPYPTGRLSTSMCSLYAGRRVEPLLARFALELATADMAIQAAPGALAPMLARARLLRHWRDHARALAAYRDVAARAPEIAEPYVGMARVLAAQGRAAEAADVLDEARARLGERPEFRTVAAIARINAGDLTVLENVDFRDADLTDVDFSGRDLRGANFSGAFLTRVRFNGSNLRGARFDGTRFGGVGMERADLRDAVFSASIGFPEIRGADLRGARLERVHFPPFQSFRDANLEGATLIESRLVAPLFGDTRLADARLVSLLVTEAFIVNPDVDRAEFRDVTFRDARVYRTATGSEGSPLSLNDLRGARLTRVQIE
jgi:uncharacterized protein YjbI with pentapeptide repeats